VIERVGRSGQIRADQVAAVVQHAYSQFEVHPGNARLGSKVMAFKCNEPAVPTIQQEDTTVRITRWDFAPGAATGWHTHGWPYFVVMLTDAVMKIEAAGAVSEVQRNAGDSYQRPRRHRARRDERLGSPDRVRRDRDQAAGSLGPRELTPDFTAWEPAFIPSPSPAAKRRQNEALSYNLNQFD